MKEEEALHRIKNLGCVPEGIIVEEAWGALWRARNPEMGSLFVVLYSEGQGAALFQEALPALRKWQKLAGDAIPGLLRIHQIEEDPSQPALIVESPEGIVLGEFTSEDPKEVARCFPAIAKTVALAKAYEIYYVALTTYNVAETPHEKDIGWRLIPIAPGARKGAGLLAGGRYAPPELGSSASLEDLNADSYAMSRLWIDLLTGDNTKPHTSATIKSLVPYPRLRTLLGNGLTPSRGHYGEAKLAQIGIERWLKTEADDDLREVQDAADASERTPAQQWLHSNRGLLIKGGSALAAVVLLVLLVLAIPRIFTAKPTTSTPYGTLALFGQALVARDAVRAKSLTTGEATPQTDRMLEDISRMEREGLASPLGAAVPQLSGAGSVRNAKIDIKGSAGDLFMNAEVTLREGQDGKWTIEKLFFQPLRESETPSPASDAPVEVPPEG